MIQTDLKMCTCTKNAVHECSSKVAWEGWGRNF